MRGFEARLTRLEGGGACPECEEARAALLESIVDRAALLENNAGPDPVEAPTRCEGCGRDVRPAVFELDALLESEGGGG